jgi:hypothetical protein
VGVCGVCVCVWCGVGVCVWCGVGVCVCVWCGVGVCVCVKLCCNLGNTFTETFQLLNLAYAKVR